MKQEIKTREDVSYIDEIVKLVNCLDDDEEATRNTIQELPLSVCYSAPQFVSVGDKLAPTHYEILLGTGGPAWRVTGELSEHGTPETASLEWQNWGTPWVSQNYLLTDTEIEALLTFAGQFYFGEGN